MAAGHKTNWYRKQLILYLPHNFFLLLFLINVTLSAYSQDHTTASDIQKPHKTNIHIEIDGVLDEPVWQEALFADKFYNKDNNSGPFKNTKVWFTYDTDNLFAAFKCQVKDISLLTTAGLDKDNETIMDNEWIGFCVDTYNDGIVAYAFVTDAMGNQLDGALNPNLDLTFSFSSNWTSAVKKEYDGYTVEMRIPLAKLPVRWNKGSAEMAILMLRHDKQNNRLIVSPSLNSDIRYILSQFQEIQIHGIRQTHPKNLSGVDITERLAYKKSKIDVASFKGRCQGGDASVMDYLIFKKREIEGADHPREFQYRLDSEYVMDVFENTEYLKDYNTNVNFETLLERAQTTAFLVLQNDTIVYENYFNGFNQDSIYTSFSVAKSFVSTLIGLAISDGYIKSDEDKITTYLPELMKIDTQFSNIAIKDLLSMSSGIAYSGEGFPSDDDITYVSPDLRNATFDNVRIAEPPGKHWLYNNYNPLLLGMILERTTQKSVSEYMEEKLWKKMGGGSASWSLDEHGFEKMESGINCSAYDYARFASLFLNNGRNNDVQVIPNNWIPSTQPEVKPKGYYDYLLDHNVYYSYFWWGKFRGNQANTNDFFGMGNKGEYVYVCPQKKLTIIRLGFEYGLSTPSPFSWPDLFYQFCTDFRTTY